MKRRGRGLLLAACLGLAPAGCTLAGVPPVAPPGGGQAGDGHDPGPPLEEGPQRSAPALPDPGEEVRALWIVRTSLGHPDSVRAMVRRADEAGFNTLFVQVRGRGDAYYESRWEPSPPLPQGFDPLALVLREARPRGLAVHAWINTHLVGGLGAGEEQPGHLLRERPDLLAVPKELARDLYRRDPFEDGYVEALRTWARQNGNRVEGIYTNPSHSEVKEHIHAIWTDIAERYDVDGLHFDYVRYPGPDFDYSRSSLHAFRRWAWDRVEPGPRGALEEALRSDPLAWVEARPALWDAFRREQITDLVRRVYHGAKKRHPGVVVSAAVFPDRDDAYRHRYQDWAGWLQEGILDVVVPMAYTVDDRTFRSQVTGAVDAAGGGARVWAGIGAYRNSVEGTLRKIETARGLGAGGVVLFSYDWAVRKGVEGRESYLRRVGEEAFGRGR